MKLKLISIIVTIICIAALLGIYYLSKQPLQQQIEERQPLTPPKEICDIFSEKNVKESCLNFKENFCRDSSDIIQCVAEFLALNVGRESAWKMCGLKTEAFLQHYCMANVLRRINLEDSLAECDLIEKEGAKSYCRADQKKAVLGVDAALPECENLKENFPTDYHFCRALVYSGVNNEIAKKECEQIEVEEKKTNCLNLTK